MRGGQAVSLLHQGHRVQAVAQIVEDEQAVATSLQSYLANHPGLAKYFRVSIDAAGKPNHDDINRAARDRVVITLLLGWQEA